MDDRDNAIADIAIIFIGAGAYLIYILFARSWEWVLRALKRGNDAAEHD